MRPQTTETARPTPIARASKPQTSPDQESNQKLDLKSNDFQNGGALPQSATCDGPGISPSLAWEGALARDAKSFALVVDDPDAPNGTFVHWILFDVPKGATSIAAGASVGVAGRNSAGTDAFKAACPPPGTGTHRYRFHLYALDVETLGLGAGASRDQVEGAMRGHVIGESTLVGTCEHRRA